jgi:hypothetical protein
MACRALDRNTGVVEKVTRQEQEEEMHFLEAVTATAPMQYVHQYLARKVPPTNGPPSVSAPAGPAEKAMVQ